MIRFVYDIDLMNEANQIQRCPTPWILTILVPISSLAPRGLNRSEHL